MNVDDFNTCNKTEKKIIKYIFYHPGCERRELCTNFNITKQAVSLVLTRLAKAGFIQYKNINNYFKPGKKPKLLFIKENAFFFLSVLIKNEAVYFSIADSALNIIAENSVPNNFTNLEESMIRDLKIHLDAFCSGALKNRMPVMTAIQIYGPYDNKAGILYGPSASFHAKKFFTEKTGEVLDFTIPLHELFKRYFPGPFCIDNTIHINSEYIARYTEYKDYNPLLIVDRGLGLSFLNNGCAVRGMDNTSGEMGRLPDQENIILGRTAALWTISRRIQTRMQNGEKTLAEYSGYSPDIPPEALGRGYLQGDSVTISETDKAVNTIWQALKNFVYLMKPRMIIFDQEFKPLHESINKIFDLSGQYNNYSTHQQGTELTYIDFSPACRLLAGGWRAADQFFQEFGVN